MSTLNKGGIMLGWCAILFILGVLAFLDAMFNPPYGDIFRKVNALLFMLISLGMLIRMRAERSKQKAKTSVTKTEKEEEEETLVPRPARDGETRRTVGVGN
jgi:hypothetical protein